MSPRRRAGLGALLAAGLLAATGPAARAQSFRDWELVAPPGAACLLHQKVIAAAAGMAIAEVFAEPRPGGGLRLSVIVPLCAALAQPMAYRLPDEARAVPLIWQSCNAETCLAQVEVGAEDRKRLAAAPSAEIGFVPVVDGRPLRFALSLMGLTAGLKAAEACAP